MSAILDRNVNLTTLGTDISGARNLEEALKMGRADYRVVETPLYYRKAGELVESPDSKLICRVNTQTQQSNTIATVGKTYSILPNHVALKGCEIMAGLGGKWKSLWVREDGGALAVRMEVAKANILGDDLAVYAIARTSHDGSAASRWMLEALRLVCKNGATAWVKTKQFRRNHTSGNVDALKDLEKEVRGIWNQGQAALAAVAEVAEATVRIPFGEERFAGLVSELLPIEGSMTARQVANVEERRSLLYRAFEAPDLARFANTGWAALQAVSDFSSHLVPRKQTVDQQVENLLKNVENDTLVKRATELVLASR